MKALIIDDEERARRVLATLITKHCPEVEIVGEAADVPEAVQQIYKLKPDVVLSDIDMPEYYGFEIVKFIKDADFALIFITAHQEYAIRAFEASAIDYILKPIKVEDLKRAIGRATKKYNQNSQKAETLLANIQQDKPSRIALPSAEGYSFVGISGIAYLIADKSYTYVIEAGGNQTLVTKNLKYFEDHLKDFSFFRSHRSYLLNLDKVSRYLRADHLVVMDDGFEIPVARDKREEFVALYKGV